MKIISPFVDHRDGKRYGIGDYDKIIPPLEDAEIERLKAAGCLEDDDDGSKAPAKPQKTKPTLTLPASGQAK